MNCDKLALEIENDWSTIAETMGVDQDYFAFFEDRFLPEIQKTIDDMLRQAEIDCFDAQAHGNFAVNQQPQFASLLNEAWSKFLSNENEYGNWERVSIEKILTIDAIEKEHSALNLN